MAINSDKLLNRPSELHRRYGGRLAMQKSLQEKMVSGSSANINLTKKSIKNIETIKVKVTLIENIFKGTLALEKKELDEKKRRESSSRREKQEDKLETRPNAEKGGLKMPKAPKMSIFDWIKNFIGNVILGYFAVRLIDHLPKIMPIVKFLGNAADFIIDVGGKLLNGLATFIDWGYKAYDATRGFIKGLGGENFAQGFDKFIGAIDTALFLTTFIAGDLLVEALTGDSGGGLGDIVGDQLKRRGAQQAATTAAGQTAGTAAKAGSIGAGTVAAVVAGAGLLSSALGEGAFQVRKVVVKPIQNLEKAYKEDKNPLTKIGRGIALTMVRPLYGIFSTVGFLLDVVGAPFRYAIELLRYPFLSEEDKVKQANNLAKFDARIREDLRKALNMLTLGLAFKEKGSFGNIYGNKGAQDQMMGKMAGGGITRGGKRQTGTRRVIGGSKKGKYKRVIPRKPGEVEIKPGADVGGEDKIFGIFPNPLKAAQRMVDVVNPFKVVKTAGEDLGKTDYFGPILAITSKITLGQKPTQRDYENVGLGINMLISKGIQEQQLKGGLVAAFAGGGFVDPDVLSAAETGGDISNWVAKTFQGEIESNAQKTLRMIRENAQKKKTTTTENLDKTTTPEGIPLGEGETASGKALMQGLIQRGFTKEEAAAIVGNLWAESGFRTTATNPSSGAFGLMQWLGGRKSRLYSYAAEKGKQVTDVDLQLDYIKWELKGGNAYETTQFKKAMAYGPGIPEKTKGFAEQVERASAGELRSSMSKRIGAAESVYGGRMVAGEKPSGPSIQLGKGYGSEGSKIAGELGRFMKKKGVVPGSIHRHPEHPPYSLTSGHSKGSLHYQGRAIDLGGYANEQGPILSALAEFNRLKGVKPVQVFHAGNEPSGHSDHVHVAYEEGGETLPYPHLATVSEKGREIVVDNDSAYSSPQVKNMLLAVNQATGYKGVMQAIQQYAPYDALSPQTIIVPSSDSMNDGYETEPSIVRPTIIAAGGEDPFESLYMGG